MNQLHEWLVGVGLPRGVDIRTTYQIKQYLEAAGAQNIYYKQLDMALGPWGGRAGIMMEANYFSLHAAIRGPVIAQRVTTPEIFDAITSQAKQEIDAGKYIWPYFLAYAQRPA